MNFSTTRPTGPLSPVRIAGVAALAAGALVIAPLGVPAALADPAPEAETTTLGPGVHRLGAAPGACAAVVTIEGANGGTAVSGAEDDENPGEDDPDQVGGGQGARISFRIPVAPTDVLDLVVGTGGSSGGPGGVSGDDQGGEGGPGTHRGAGGGGYTSFAINGTEVALAGGGGGSGGGHNPDAGGGGHAGVVEGPGVWAGQEGAAGNDDSAPGAPGGGAGGGTSLPGAGGVHPNDAALSGLAGVGRNGGTGGTDASADQGGGGGAGYTGGGGGASTVGDVSGVNGGIIGGGGGGGSSYFATADTGASFIAPAPDSGEALAPNGGGRNGTAQLDWEPCTYDLTVAKSAGSKVFEPGVPVTFKVVVTNNGAERMGLGDTVTITDPKATGATLLSVRSSKGAPFTCDVAVGEVIATGVLDCSQPVGELGVRGLDVREQLTVRYRQTYTEPYAIKNTVSVTDRGNQDNNTASAVVKSAKPGLRLVKKASRTKVTRVGQKVTYTFRVRNTGNIELKPIRIVEGAFSGRGTLRPTCPRAAQSGLAPQQVIVCTATYRVTRADLNRGRIDNTATVRGRTPSGRLVESAPSTARVTARPPLPGVPATGARVAPRS
ncbi:DUF7507 domain-containing protein [Nocardioides sp. J54]|uniref:DUF7507 domain-containing protein n=1 Tax=Nocardioides sp. J54 TaxID=935866 RepID=UPI0004ADD02C|nr:DUF11 domain-containing protein [Nocardioides sp. J54]